MTSEKHKKATPTEQMGNQGVVAPPRQSKIDRGGILGREAEERLSQQIEQYEAQLAAAKEGLGKPFPQEEELQRINARLVELNAELDVGGSAASAAILDDGDDDKARVGHVIAVVLVIVLVCFMGSKKSVKPESLDEQPVTITELGEDGLTASYTDASGRTRTVTVTTDVTTTVQDINGQEIGMDELLVTNTVQVKLNAEGKAESILLLPDTSDEYC